jgi:hypothetical protein
MPQTAIHLSQETKTIDMPSQSFFLLGESSTSARAIDVPQNATLDDLRDLIASHFAIVAANG